MVNHQTIGDRAAPLPPDDLAALRRNLREQRAFRREQLRRMAEAPRTEHPPRRGSAARTEVRIKLAASARMVLHDVEAALRRIAEGSYGICQLCRRPVERERLMIVPQARYCARCQQVREAAP
ncbi:TraR/DksA family transcriptional regulator [Streptomyces sp. NPDC091377]|uniref:TraR/DksA family transcriptional regulator n=1 Tax=unclassified Streptomyces TaxID=2593676 RepID=UPI00382C13CD